MEINVCLDLLHPHLMHSLLQWWVETPPVGSLTRLSPRQLTVHPVVEVPEGPDHLGRQYPSLQPTYKDYLYHGLVKQARYPRVFFLPPQDP